MKMTKKKVFVVALVVCLLATISMGTLAWFSAQDEVDNTFYVADSSTTDPSKVFAVDVYETTPDGDNDQDGHAYTNILPGDVLEKDVFVKNTGVHDQYVRVIVTISDRQAWVSALGANFNVTDVFGGFDPTLWNHIYNNVVDEPNSSELVYVLYYKDVVKAIDPAINVFDSFKVPTTLTLEQAAAFGADGFTITVKAQAVQAENIVPANTAAEDAAYEAFKVANLA